MSCRYLATHDACQTLDRLALAALHAGEDEQLDAGYAAAMLQDYYGAAASSGSNGSNATAAAQEAEEGGRRRGQRRRLASTAAGGGGDTGVVGGCSLDQKRLGLTLESTFGQAAVTQRRLPAPPPPPPVVVPPTGKLRPVFACTSIRAHLHVLFLSLFLSGTQASPPSTLSRA